MREHEHLTRGYTLNRQRFEQNAAELEAALQLVKKAASCLRLVSALLAECDEEWMTGKVYLNLKD